MGPPFTGTEYSNTVRDQSWNKLSQPFCNRAHHVLYFGVIGTNWMDGTMGVTQCAIPPGQSFTYNFTVPNQWGTYWWHAHASSQYIDGIVGPLIIHSPDEPHLDKYQEDVIMFVSDYYHTPSGPLVSWYL